MHWLDRSVSVSMPLLLLLAAASVFSVPVSLAEQTCIVKLPADRCLGDPNECVEERLCHHGYCDSEPHAGCVCNPCWTGNTCNDYVDKFGPTFADRDVFHKVTNSPQGRSYTLEVNDDDLGLTCPLGMAGPPARCPCSEVEYRLVSSELGSDAVELDRETGVLTVTDFSKLDCSRRYRLQIEAHSTPPVDAFDVRPYHQSMNLTLYCDPDVEAELRRAMEEAEEIEAGSSDALLPPPQNSLQELTRRKRSTGGDPKDTTMAMARPGSTTTSPKVGTLLTWTFTITLDTVSDLDMIVEAFVTDSTNPSVFNILSMAVKSVGSAVTSTASDLASSDAFTGTNGQIFYENDGDTIVERALINLGSLTNPGSSGTDSEILIELTAVVIHNPDVTAGTKQFVAMGAEYSESNYVQISQEEFTPDSTASDIPTAVGSVTAVADAIEVGQYSATWAEFTLPVAAAVGAVQVEAHIAGTYDEDALSIGGAWVELGTDFLEPTKFNGDDYRINQILSRSGEARRLTTFEFDFLQGGDSTALPADTGRTANIKIPVYATGKAAVGSSGLLVVFVRVKDRLSGSYEGDGSVTKFTVTVTSGTAPTAAGSLTLSDKQTLVSSSNSVPVRSVVEYDVVATVSSGGAFVASETLTLDTSSTSGLRACDVEVISQGVNIIYIQSTSVQYTPENGDSSAVLTITGLQAADMTTDPKGNELKFRLAMRADAAGAADFSMDSSTFSLPSVNASGDPAGTQPSVTVSSSAGSTAYIGSQFGIDLTVEYPANDLASTGENNFEVEFVNDLRTSYEVRMCSVHVVSVGRDLPCVRSKVSGGLSVTYSLSNSSRQNKDVASTSLPLTCASLRDPQEAAQRTVIVRAVGHFIGGQTLSETTFNPGAGMVFDENTLYAGLVGEMTLAAELTAYTGGTGDPTIIVPNPGQLTYGKVHMVKVVVYIPPGGNSPALSITATSSDPAAFRVDRIYLSGIGRNFGCLSTENRLVNLDQLRVTDPNAMPETYPAFSVDSSDELGSSATILLGAVSNVGSASNPSIKNTVEETDVLVYDNHIVLAVAVQGVIGADSTAPADASFDLTVSGSKDASSSITSSTSSITFSGSDTPYSAASDSALTATFLPRDGDTIYREIPKIVDLAVDLPVGFYGTLKVQCMHGDSDTSQWEVKGAAAVRHGQNVHGVWVPEAKATPTKGTLGGVELVTQADLVLPDVTRLETLMTPADDDSKLKVACVVLVPATSDASGSITVKAVLLDGSDAEIGSPFEATLTLSSDEYTHSGGTTLSTNQTVDLSGNSVAPSASIGQYFWVPFKLIVPPGIHSSELAIVTATDTARAFYTVHGIRYGANMGADVVGAPLITEELLNFTHTNRNLTHLSQFDTVLVNFGSITNLGLGDEVFRGKGSDAEWGMEMEVQLQVTDHPQLHSTATATKPVHISFKLGDTIVVESQDVTATVGGSEKIILETEFTLREPQKLKYDKETDQKVGMSVIVRHSNLSTQEAVDGRVLVIFPLYMNYTEGNVTTNASSITVLFKGSSAAFVVGDIYFTDIFTIDFNASIDPNYVRGYGSGWANATTLARPICRPSLATNAFTRCGPMNYIMYEVSNPECSDPLLATLPDCYFAVSAAIERGGSHGPAAIKGAGWRPPVREDPSWTSQYVEIRFGVPTRISGWKVTNSGARKVTEVKIMASDDGLFFREKYTGSVTDGMAKEDLGENSFRTKYARIVISAADADASDYIQMSAELYGCHPDTSPESTCPTVQDNTIYSTEPRKWRHFAVDTTNNIVYYCDYDKAREAQLCFASRDDEVWIGQPKYVGELRGHSDGRMYAYDSKMASTLASSDGEHWEAVDAADVPASFDDVMVVKGATSADTTPVTQGGYEGDYHGIKKDGSYLVKWGKCCSN